MHSHDRTTAETWRSRTEGTVYTTAEVLQKLLQMQTGIVLLDGESGCGKTRLLHRFREESGKEIYIFSYAEMTEELLNQYRKVDSQTATARLGTLLGAYDGVAVEDLDYLGGRVFTLAGLGEIFREVSRKMPVILTGIDLEHQIPELLEELENPMYFLAE